MGRGVIVAAIVALGSSPARGEPTAGAPYAQGRERFDARDFRAAASSYEAAFAATPAPRYLFNLALALRLDGQCDRAIETYRRFLDMTAPAEFRQRAIDGIALCERTIAEAK